MTSSRCAKLQVGILFRCTAGVLPPLIYVTGVLNELTQCSVINVCKCGALDELACTVQALTL